MQPLTNTTDTMRRRPRHGLAMLELVLAIPLLLCLMALMVNYGAAATWKVRALVASRHAAWSARSPRNAAAFPRPFGAAAINRVETNEPEYAESLDDDPALHQPVVRGPLPQGNRVDSDLLNCNRGLQSAQALVERQFPLLTRMGAYRWDVGSEVLSDRWRYTEMGMRHTGQRRIPVIYQLAQAPSGLLEAFIRAVRTILDPRLQWALRALDHDDEFLQYQQRFAHSPIMAWGDTPPDFHPSLGSICSGDPARMQEHVDDLIEQIRDLPENMARGFKKLYERVVQELEWRIVNDPSLSPGDISAIMDEISQLQAKIQTLDAYLQTQT